MNSTDLKGRPACCVEPARLNWDATGNPQSSTFGDIYYSRDNGLEESGYVFLKNNFLPERWSTPLSGNFFCIAETGFGTGLNFLNAWHLWRHSEASKTATLHFVSFEKFPMSRADLASALMPWTSILGQEIEALVRNYPPPLSGLHRLSLDQGKVQLSLFLGDVMDGLERQSFFANAWFLDGFAPAKNPQMWNDQLLEAIAQHASIDCTLSTFTSVGRIRRKLAELGFLVEKVKGFGKKREMLRAVYKPASAEPTTTVQAFPKKFCWANGSPVLTKKSTENPVVIVGAGLSGCWTARTLAERGLRVTVIDKNDRPASEASGNPKGVLYCKPGREYTVATQLGLMGCLYSSRMFSALSQHTGRTDLWHPCGTLLQAFNDKTANDHKILAQSGYPADVLEFLSQEEASARAGISLPTSAVRLAPSGWASPVKICEVLMDHPNIRFVGNRKTVGLTKQNDDSGWIVRTIVDNDARQEECLETPIVVLCTATETRELTALQYLPLKPIRGQITLARLRPGADRPDTVVCGEGYVCPPDNDWLCFGATFNLNSTSLALSDEDHQANLEMLKKMAPALFQQLAEGEPAQMRGRVGFRCTVSDYLPVIGPVPDEPSLRERFGVYRHNAQAKLDTSGTYQSGLFVNTGHGSKGLSTTPLAAQIIAGYLFGEPMPLNSDILAALHPARFLIKRLKQNRL